MGTTVLVALLTGCAAEPADPSADPPADPYPDQALDTYHIDVQGDASQFMALAQRPQEPFVMVNLLAFRDMAEGEGFEGLTGAEAYAMYVDLISNDQAEAGSRNFWSASIYDQLVGSSDPLFASIALNEYASPAAFFEYVQREGSEAADAAREAGLAGQWGIVSTTLTERDPSTVVAEASAPSERDLELTGLSPDQQARLVALADVAPIGMVELVRFTDEAGATAAPWRSALDEATEEQGGVTVWHGSLDTQLIGSADPGFSQMRVTLFPGAGALAAALADPDVVEASSARTEGLAYHWLYLARTGGLVAREG
ncbi:MAG: hypothetical protein AAGF11_53900 [Myxococcota bacterium]